MIAIQVTNQQSRLAIDSARLQSAVEAALEGAKLAAAEISLVVVDDATIHRLNRQYLDHDYATDVLSFQLEQSEAGLEGEVVVSAERAAAVAVEYGWSPEEELLLYVIHGVLHLVGYDDTTPGKRAAMRRRERACLGQLGLEARFRRRRSGTAPKSRRTSGGVL